MFASHALPPPSSFGLEHRSLRLAAEVANPQPQGGCHYKHPSEDHRQCLCQTYQHNRSAPGNICDCGHAACYHSLHSRERIADTRVINALVEKIRNLEELVIRERDSRNNLISQERHAWEWEVRVLREALAPSPQTELELKRRLVQLEDTVGLTFDEHCRLKKRMLALDHAGMQLEQRVESYETRQSRKRKASIGRNGVMSPESNYACSSSSPSDATMISMQKSSHPPSPLNPPLPACVVDSSPRSSGVLNLKGSPVPQHIRQSHKRARAERMPLVNNEPRSSGFLSIDLAERLRTHKLDAPDQKSQIEPVASTASKPPQSGLPSPPYCKVSSGRLPISCLLSDDIKTDAGSHLSKKRRQAGGSIAGLQLLADAASPLAQQV